MSYTFHLCRLRNCPNVIGWWQEIQPQEYQKVESLHRGVSAKLFMQCGVDPHNDIKYSDNTNDIDERDFLSVIRHPIILGAKYLNALNDQTLFKRNTLLVNRVGGWCHKDDSMEILETRTTEWMSWPEDIPEQFRPTTQTEDLYKETIRISQWPDGTHFYLRSNKKRVFFPEKHDTYEAAFNEAKRYVTEDRIINAGRIRVSEYSKIRPRDGD